MQPCSSETFLIQPVQQQSSQFLLSAAGNISEHDKTNQLILGMILLPSFRNAGLAALSGRRRIIPPIQPLPAQNFEGRPPYLHDGVPLFAQEDETILAITVLLEEARERAVKKESVPGRLPFFVHETRVHVLFGQDLGRKMVQSM